MDCRPEKFEVRNSNPRKQERNSNEEIRNEERMAVLGLPFVSSFKFSPPPSPLSPAQISPMMPNPVSEPVAQLVEHRTFNPWVAGSIPAGLNFVRRATQSHIAMLV